jgi:plasmid stabilization system protein ParE
MEKYQVVYKKRFQQKFLRLLNYLNTEWGIKVTDNFIATFQERITTLISNPNMGKQSSILEVRSILITKHNRLYYRVKNDTIEIVNFYDTRINPKNNPYKLK